MGIIFGARRSKRALWVVYRSKWNSIKWRNVNWSCFIDREKSWRMQTGGRERCWICKPVRGVPTLPEKVKSQIVHQKAQAAKREYLVYMQAAFDGLKTVIQSMAFKIRDAVGDFDKIRLSRSRDKTLIIRMRYVIFLGCCKFWKLNTTLQTWSILIRIFKSYFAYNLFLCYLCHKRDLPQTTAWPQVC